MAGPGLQVINSKRFSFSLGFIRQEKLHWLNSRKIGHIQRNL